jgi:tetratricopeptide (TPR) repeat protein
MITDAQDNILTGATPEAAALLDEAVGAFNIYRGDPFALLDRAALAAPSFAMAPLAKAWLFALSSEPLATREAGTLLARARALPLNEREASLAAALESLLGGEWTAAARLLEHHSMAHPRDMLALQAGHLLDFFCANARTLRDRIARALPHWSRQTPGYAVLLGMHAFGLEECGDHARAEETGRRALDLDPADCWAHHAVAHVMEMQGRAHDGIGWMITREPHWAGEDNFFKGHNWWHRALFHLDLGQTEEALALYDGPIREGRSAVAMDMIDASALLWRLHMSGQDVGKRWNELADGWDHHADGRTYPFNDWHAAMAYLGAGRYESVTRLIAQWRHEPRTEAQEWGHRHALPLVEGFAAFWRGDHDAACTLLHGGRHIAYAFGGSNAQRDLIDWTLTEAAVRSGRTALAESLARERLALKPHSPRARTFLARALAVTPQVQRAA